MKSLLKLLQDIKNTVIEPIGIVGGPDAWDTALALHARPAKGQVYRCPICKKKMPCYGEGQGARDWRALDLGVIKVCLRGRAPRVKRMEHGIKAAPAPWARHGPWFPCPFEEWAAWTAPHANRSVVSGCCRIDWHTVGDATRRVEEDLRALRASRFDSLIGIGVDEASYRKGHRCLAVAVGHDGAGVIWAHKGHGKAALAEFFESLAEEQGASIKCAAGDGAAWVTERVSGLCPDAARLPDAFHIAAWAAGALDNVRKRIWNEARKEEARTIGRRGRGRPKKGGGKPAGKAAGLKGSRLALLKNPEGPARNQQVKLETMAGGHDGLYRAYLLKERLRLLPEMAPDEAQAEVDERISWAQRCRIPGPAELSRKIRKHKERVIGTVASGMSNARVEGINNKVKAITKRAYGSRNVDNLIAMVYLCRPDLPFALPGREPIAAVS
jgi:transposase